MGVGKTALFFRLKQGLFRETHTSMKENDATFVPVALQGKVRTVAQQHCEVGFRCDVPVQIYTNSSLCLLLCAVLGVSLSLC